MTWPAWSTARYVAPSTCDLHIGLVDPPTVPDHVPAGPGSLGQQRHEADHPPVDGDVVDLHSSLGEQLLDIAIRQREA
jgi:hypothetical protein